METRKKVGLFTALAGAALVVTSVMAGTASASNPVTGGQQISSGNTNVEWDGQCNESEWHWLINGLGNGAVASDVPATITVSWNMAPSPTVIALDNVTGGTAHYRYFGHLGDGALPTGATATFPAGTTVTSYNNFNLSHGGLCTDDTEPDETNPPDTNPEDTNPPDTNPEDTNPPDTSPDTTDVGQEGPTTTQSGSGGELPQTGSTQGLALTVGLVLLGLGAVLATITRRSATS